MTLKELDKVGEMIGCIERIHKCRADMLDEHMMFVKVVADAIQSKAIPPMPIEVAEEMKFVNASRTMGKLLIGLIRELISLAQGNNPDKKEVAK